MLLQVCVLLYNQWVLQNQGIGEGGVSLDYTLLDFGARADRIQVQRSLLQASELVFNDTHRKLIFAVTHAYYQLLLAAYLAYHFFEWRGLNSSVATCMITALSTTGSSRRKQILRVAGAITGGLLFAIAAEVFLLPQMDSVFGFTILFGAVTVFSAWFATSSPRLSYYGLQVAFAFYIVHLRAFSPERQL